jgi:RNA polymerase sigma factor for flagellar operon FliA
MHDVVPDEKQPTASDQAMKNELIKLIVDRLQQLPEMQRKILAMYYFENLRLAEIAKVFGVTESRICQIHTQAVLSLKTYIRSATAR